jgi:hypothetical protein
MYLSAGSESNDRARILYFAGAMSHNCDAESHDKHVAYRHGVRSLHSLEGILHIRGARKESGDRKSVFPDPLSHGWEAKPHNRESA